MKKMLILLKRIHASTEEIEMGLSTYLKESINKSKISCDSLGEENLAGLKPKNGETFYANICEGEYWRGKYNVCKDPVISTLIDSKDKNYWKIVYCRKICDKIRKSGICRRALVKIAYV